MNTLRGYITLTRPANLPTAIADIMAGAAVSLAMTYPDVFTDLNIGRFARPVILLSLASVCLYASGVVFNDYFDRETDAIERPERPIPSGVVTARSAAVFGSVLMFAGIALAFMVSTISGGIAILLGAAILSYDSMAKQSTVLGPLNMGVCRGLNLLLGMSVIGFPVMWWMALIPVMYIGAITLVSRGEVNGSNRSHIRVAFLLYILVVALVAGLYRYGLTSMWYTLPFIIVFCLMILIPLWWAYRENTPDNIRRAVKAGVISLILLDACIAVIFAGWQAGLSVVLLLPLSLWLSRRFAVT
ncbi:UbiA-like protein EboC [Robertkochia sediminum]|uniref:UbiA-like protein EboC n=1 Tax=Robertkochia sediminum TaxID=2785326 RepID=UPI0019330072|nr:UbiA-like protein EboC [Robertkochia sediminum]MBL7474149.1 UbiA-like protein EboC [Robertkochia sediminum]